jgi:hypothetical protein
MKPVIALSLDHYESLLKRAPEDSALYFRLKNAVLMANTVVVRCDPEQAEMLLQAATHFCPDAVPEIQQAIRFSFTIGLTSATREEAGLLFWRKKRMDELAREYLKTREAEIREEIYRLGRELEKMKKQ